MDNKNLPLKNKLTNEQIYITQKHGTEKPFSGKYLNNKDEGIYECVCCNNQLFSSNAKYDSGTGWPSFYQPLEAENLISRTDKSFFSIP